MLIAAGLAGFVLYDLQAGLTLRSTALLILADTVEILIASLGVSYFCAGLPRLNSVASLASYSFLAVVLAPMAAAFISTSASSGNYWIRWRIGFFTEALALLTLTPAILAWVRTRQAWVRKSRAFYFEAATLVAGLTLLGYVAFVAPVRSSAPVLLYSLLPFLLWSALRFGMMGISTSMILVAFLSIWGAVHGRGPFTGAEPLNNVMSLQLFLFFAVAPFMVLAVLVEERKRTGHALRESEERFRLMADTAPALIWMSGIDKLCTYFNKPWLDFTGRSMDSELGNGWVEGVHAEDLRRCVDTYTQAFDRREEFRMEYRLRRHDGEYRWVLDIGVPRFDQDCSFVGYIGIAVDVTDRRLVEETLRESKAQFLDLAEQSRTTQWEVDPQGLFIYVSHVSQASWGYCPDEVVGRMHFYDLHPEEGRKAFKAAVFAVIERKQPFLDVVHTVETKDGRIAWGSANGIPLLNADGTLRCYRGSCTDITERKLAEEALSCMNRRVIEAEERERERIARDLHENVGQRLALLAIAIEQLKNDLPYRAVEVLDRTDALWSKTLEILTDVKTSAHELYSPRLEYLGIAAVMRTFCEEFAVRKRVKIDFRSHGFPSLMSPDVSICLFRVLQEALHNGVMHSGVQKLSVQFWVESDQIHLRVSDSGVGFDLKAARRGRGLGLVRIEQRVKLVEGTSSIDSQPEKGTTIQVSVPLRSARDSMHAAG